MRICLSTQTASEDERPRAIEEALVAAGAQVTREPGARIEVLVFEKPSAEIFEATRELSDGGKRRVLVLALDAAALRGSMPWELLRAGASDVLSWDDPVLRTKQITARIERWAAVDTLIASPLVQGQVTGQSAAWMATLRRLVEVAGFSSGPVLLLGESGTGKELLARLVHALDGRVPKAELVVLDCTTVVPELSGSEFFGHERGSFTSAAVTRDGAFAVANGGTLFLDEVGELPLALQAQLLRVVQERTYKRVGGNTWFRTDFRLVCATNRDLEGEMARGAFRSDLYHRIASRVCRVPPLRERREDVLPLVRHFFQEMRPGQPVPPLDPAVEVFFLSRDYPGNVRELKQLVARVADRHVYPGPVTVGELPDEEIGPAASGSDWRDGFKEAIRHALALGVGLRDIGRAASEIAVRVALETEGNNLQRAAKRLGVTDRALQMRRAQNGEPVPGDPC